MNLKVLAEMIINRILFIFFLLVTLLGACLIIAVLGNVDLTILERLRSIVVPVIVVIFTFSATCVCSHIEDSLKKKLKKTKDE